MIAYISGDIFSQESTSVVVLTQGIGYRVFCTTKTLSNVVVGQYIELYTYHHVKEDAQQLFGFVSRYELVMFEQLITISGVGPKSGLAILSVASLADIEQAVFLGDPKILTKVSGIGKKTAERIVLELKGKLGAVSSLSETTASSCADVDVIEALEQLGYSLVQAREVVASLEVTYTTVDEKLKESLRRLGR